MKKRNRIPVNLNITNSGSLLDVVNEFIELMENATGGNVDVDIDLKGNVTIYFKNEIPKLESIPELDIDVLYRNDYRNF